MSCKYNHRYIKTLSAVVNYLFVLFENVCMFIVNIKNLQYQRKPSQSKNNIN